MTRYEKAMSLKDEDFKQLMRTKKQHTGRYWKNCGRRGVGEQKNPRRQRLPGHLEVAQKQRDT